MRKKYPVIAKGEISFLETKTDMVLAYKRVLEREQIIVFCNLDEKEQKITIEKEWQNYQILLENYQDREINRKEEQYTMNPYEFMVLGTIEN